jgi:hypothetical protein
MNDTHVPAPAEPLAVQLLRAIADPGNVPAPGNFKGDRTVSEWSRDSVVAVLTEGGWIMEGVPPVQQVLAQAEAYSDELILTKLVARFFRVMILGALIIPETPQAMDWLRDYIDGIHKVHGPLGKPMLWPGRLPAICSLLRDWGFQPTPTNPQFVSLRPGGAAFAKSVAMPDPAAPDRDSVAPLDPRRALTMASLLDSFTDGVSCMALDRSTVLRAMSAAFDRGATHFDATPIMPALHQLRDHQQQATEDGSMVTVSRQAIDEVIAHLAGDTQAGRDHDELIGKVGRLLGEPDDHGHPSLAEDADRSELADVLSEVHGYLTGEDRK